MNRHNKKYHCGDHLKDIPTSLRKTYTPKQEKSRFSLEEPPSKRRKSSFYAAEEDKIVSEVDAALDPADSVQDLKPSTTKCICGFSDEGIGYLINCDACDTAQHFQCYYVNEDGNFSELDEHYCIDCKPRPIDAKMATIRQKDRKNEFSEYLHAVELAGDEKDYGPAWQDTKRDYQMQLMLLGQQIKKREQQKDAERTKQLQDCQMQIMLSKRYKKRKLMEDAKCAKGRLSN